MLSKNTLKFIKSLQQKKFRKKENAFLVEGAKNVQELLEASYTVQYLLYTDTFAQKHPETIQKAGDAAYQVSAKDLQASGTFKQNDMALAVAEIPEEQPISPQPQEWVLALDEVRDPGNLGTLLRIADWYGIRHMVCSPGTADLYNPKVINSSMGSFCRIQVQYTDLNPYLASAKVPVYGAFLEGTSIYKTQFPQAGILLMGSESHGISPALAPYVSKRITIPRFGQAESLNVAVATAICCDHIKRPFL